MNAILPLPSSARAEGVRLIGMPSPFRDDVVQRIGAPGRTVAQLVEDALGVPLTPDLAGQVRVTIEDTPLLPGRWHRIRPKAGTTVLVRVVPQDGALRIVLTLAIVVAAAYLGPIAAGFALGGATAAAAGVSAATFAAVSAAATGVIAIGGNILLNALIPPRAPNLSASSPSPTYNIGGTRNSSGAWQVIPWVLGRHRYAPLYIARPFTEVVGSDQYLRVMFVWSYGPLRIEDIRIGETLIGDFDDVEVETREGLPGDPPTTLYPGQVFEETLSIYLGSGDDWQVRRTEADTDEISIDLSFPRGLIDYSKSNKKKPITSSVDIEMRKVGDADWTLVTHLATTEKRQEPFRRGYRWVVPKGQYDVRLKRTDEESDTGTDRTEWSTLRSIKVGAPYTFRKPLAVTVVRIRAQDQLQGVIDTLTGIANSRCKSWNGAAWVDDVETSNPADLFRYVLQGPGCAQPRADALLNLPVLQDWHQHCAALGLEFNMVRDFEATLPSVLDDVAAAGHAARSMPDGRWSVAIDRPQAEPMQAFTARNSWGFTTEPLFGEIPHCYRCRFVDRDADWDVNAERLVFDDGYDESNATLYEEIQFPGVTDAARVWKEAKRRFAELRTRYLAHSTNADWEYLVARRGDLVLGAHNVLGVGLTQGRVKAVSVQGKMVGVELDDAVTMAAGKSYVIRFRRRTLTFLLRTVATRPGTHTIVWLPSTGELPEADDLFLFGEAGKESRRLIVKNVEAAANLSARLSFVDEAPEIHEVEALTPPAWVPRQPQRDQDTPAVPRIISVSSGDAAQTVGEDGSVLAPVTVGVAPGGGGRVAAAEFQLRHRPAGSTAPWLTETVAAAQGAFRILGYEVGEAIELQPRARTGLKVSLWGPVYSYTVAARTFTPPDVATFTVTRLATGMRQFRWTYADSDGSGQPADLAGVLIRYRAGTGFTWDDLNPLNSAPISSYPWETAEPGPAGTYTFGIVSKNDSGNQGTPLLITVSLGPGIVAPVPVITWPPPGGVSTPIGNTNPVVIGTSEPSASDKVFVDGLAAATVTADAGGNWSAPLTGLTGGGHTFTASQSLLGASSGQSDPAVVFVQWQDPGASGEADFVLGRYCLNGAVVDATMAGWSGLFDTIVTGAQILTKADGSLIYRAANALPWVPMLGLVSWEARTNRNTNFSCAPATGVTTNLTKSGDPAGVLGCSADAQLSAGILSDPSMASAFTTGNSFDADNTAGTADMLVTFGGTAASTAAHSWTCLVHGDAGSFETTNATPQTIASFAASSSFQVVKVNGFTPGAATDQIRLRVPPGKRVRFIANQLELGAYATSIVPIAGAAATRPFMQVTRTLGADFNASEGYLGARAKIQAGVTTTTSAILGTQQADSSNGHQLRFLTTASVGGRTVVGGADQATPATGHASGALDQVVYGWKANDFAFAKGGGAAIADTSGTVPSGTPAKILVGHNGTASLSGVIERVKWGKTRPSNAAIQAMSGWTLL